MNKIREMHKCCFSGIVDFFCRWRICRKFLMPVVLRSDGGKWYSVIWRKILAIYYGLTVGDYSYGSGFTKGAVPAGVEIGRYVSIG